VALEDPSPPPAPLLVAVDAVDPDPPQAARVSEAVITAAPREYAPSAREKWRGWFMTLRIQVSRVADRIDDQINPTRRPYPGAVPGKSSVFAMAIARRSRSLTKVVEGLVHTGY